MLSVGALVAGLFGSGIIHRHKTSVLIALALISFGLSAILAVYVIWPRNWQGFEHDMRPNIAELDAGEPIGMFALATSWAEYYETSRACNQTKLKWLTWAFTAICALVGAQVLFWGLAVL